MIETISLFPTLNQKLIELLKSLSEDEWNKPTIAKLWTVKDIAAHLLDTNIRTIAMRDQYLPAPDSPINSYQDLVGYLNHLNAVWVSAARRVSPPVLIDMLQATNPAYTAYLASLEPNADAMFSVAWAGEQTSKNWFHVAREYTEKWHHQQQIRDAVGKPGIMSRELFYPVLDTFICGLPHTYKNTIATPGTVVKITVDTAIGGNWFLIYNGKAWQLSKQTQQNIMASITIPPDTAWKVFTKGITRNEALQAVTISGDEELAKVALSLLAVIA